MKKKICTCCITLKPIKDYYTSRRTPTIIYKSECKKCTISRNQATINRKRRKKKMGGDPRYQAYQNDYYQKNKEKFRQYRLEFKERHPDYGKQRYWKAKDKRIKAQEALTERDI